MKSKTLTFLIAMTICTISFMACNSEFQNGNTATTSVAETPKEALQTASVGRMDEFMKMLDGTTEGASKAYNTYASQGLKDYNANACMSEFCDYNLKDAKVVATTGMCCTMEAASGVTVRTYKICWTGDTISGIEFMGMK